MGNSFSKAWAVWLASAAVAAAPAGARAAAAESPFGFFEEEARVVTVSRRPEPVSESPAAVTVITRSEIRDSGAENLWDLFRFHPGMSVVDGRSIEGNRAVVSIRGWAREFVPDLLVLIDGRSVYSPDTGGVYWEQLPVLIGEIERIEIVRGPNAALYGSNAVRGVINIITREPGRESQISGEAMGGTPGAWGLGARVQGGAGPVRLRAAFRRRVEEGFAKAGGGESNDFIVSEKASFRGIWEVSEDAELELFAGGSLQRFGVESPRSSSERSGNHFEMLKASRRFGPGFTLRWSGSRRDNRGTLSPLSTGSLDHRDYQYDNELVQEMDFFRGHWRVTAGAAHRYSRVDSAAVYGLGSEHVNRVIRGFVHQTARLGPRAILSAGFSREASDAGGLNSAYQGTLSFSPRAEHWLRFTHSRAPSIPSVVNKEIDFFLSPSLKLIGNENLPAERADSWEAGYRGRFLGGKLSFETAFAYMTIDRVPGAALHRAFPSPALLRYEIVNMAVSRSLENSLTLRPSPGREVFLNHTLLSVADALGDQRITRSAPRHTVNLGGRTDLPGGFRAGFRLGHSEGYRADSASRGGSVEIAGFWRLDARVSRRFGEDSELWVSGRSLLSPRRREFADGLEVPRSIRAGVSVRFGPGRGRRAR